MRNRGKKRNKCKKRKKRKKRKKKERDMRLKEGKRHEIKRKMTFEQTMVDV